VQNRPQPDKLIAVILRMAKCQGRAAQPEQALESYHLAETLAVQTKQAKLESVAYVSEAALQSKGGKVSEALALYQAALRLDNGIGDQPAEAQDWAAFGQFLDQAGFPPRLAYACLVNAERLTKTQPDASNEMVTRSRKEMEARLGSGAAALRRNPEPVLQEALALRR
jgi:tetratricopeptide (TPR) repeat protein